MDDGFDVVAVGVEHERAVVDGCIARAFRYVVLSYLLCYQPTWPNERSVPTVPAPVLAQAWRGGAKEASLSRLLALCEVEPMSEAQARSVGRLASQSQHDDVVDLTVVEGALRRRDAIVTSDPRDLRRVAAAAGSDLALETV